MWQRRWTRYQSTGREEALFAFHDPRLVAAIAEITCIEGLQPDPNLYAGG